MRIGPNKLLRRMRGNSMYGPATVLGIIAGIAVPAYQDYTLRARVAEGLRLASNIKAAVAESFAASGQWPRDLRALEFTSAPRGQYVTFAALNRGTVVIRFSSAAGPQLAGLQLTLRPTTTHDDDVVWSCGYAADPGVDPADGPASPHATTVPAKFLPRSCRGG